MYKIVKKCITDHIPFSLSEVNFTYQGSKHLKTKPESIKFYLLIKVLIFLDSYIYWWVFFAPMEC